MALFRELMELPGAYTRSVFSGSFSEIPCAISQKLHMPISCRVAARRVGVRNQLGTVFKVAPVEELGQVLGGVRGTFRCHAVFNCQTVCPKKLDPSAAIARIKRHAVRHGIGSLFGTGGKG